MRGGVSSLNIRSKLFTMLAITAIVASVAAPSIRLAHATMTYTFQGLIDEDTGLFLGPVNVTAVFAGGSIIPNDNFTVNGNYTYSPATVPEHFIFDLGYTHREYWLKPTETIVGNIFIFNSSRFLQSTQVVCRDQVGSLDNFTVIYAGKYVNGIFHISERRYLDINKATIMALEYGTSYYFTLTDTTFYTFGQVAINSNPIYLLVTGLQFPQNIILSYQYVRIYANRAFSTPSGSISVSYQDTLNATTSVTYAIYYNNGSLAYTNTIAGSSAFVDTWNAAANNTDYALQAIIYHSTLGSFTWRQYFGRSFSTAPFDLSFLGNWPIASSAIIPALLIVFAFGSFSMLNAYIGAFFGCVTAAIVTYLGWIAIPSGALTIGFGFAILIGVTFAKRRLWT